MTHIVKQEKFEGPLELLLELIQKEKLSINEVSLARVTDQYVSEIEKLAREGRIDQEALAEFLVIAGELLLIKSRSLLPEYAQTSEEQASVEELASRLAALKRIRDASQELGKLGRRRQFIFSREPYLGIDPVFYPPEKFYVDNLRVAFLKVYEALPKLEKLVEEKIQRIVSMEEKIKELQELFTAKVERLFSEVIKGGKEKAEIIVSFLAILELAKQKLFELDQDKIFGDIRIRKI
ncbi:MAG: segregation/condensation protein A [bacterium]|nr:segregation/condensation protein A [bacterium]